MPARIVGSSSSTISSRWRCTIASVQAPGERRPEAIGDARGWIVTTSPAASASVIAFEPPGSTPIDAGRRAPRLDRRGDAR